jgi:CheY-like chemotaxis protein
LKATDPKVLQRFEPHLRRVLIVDPTPVAARMLAGLLRGLGARELPAPLQLRRIVWPAQAPFAHPREPPCCHTKLKLAA